MPLPFAFTFEQIKNEADGQALTPLVVACRNGHEKVIRILLTHFAVNMEQECRAKFDGHIVEGATALWCAAGAGQYAALYAIDFHYHKVLLYIYLYRVLHLSGASSQVT